MSNILYILLVEKLQGVSMKTIERLLWLAGFVK